MELIKTFIAPCTYGIISPVRKERADSLAEMKQLFDFEGAEVGTSVESNIYGEESGFSFEEGGYQKTYFMLQEPLSIVMMTDFVKAVFPNVDRSQLFGLHPSALLKVTRDQAIDLFRVVYQDQFIIKRPSKRMQSSSDEKQVTEYETFRARLYQVKRDCGLFFKPAEYVGLTVNSDKGFNTLIHKEISMYNNLMMRIHMNLEESVLVIEGLKVSNERTTATLECLQSDRTPPEWLAHSYPASHSLPVFISNLKQRVLYIRSLLSEA